MADATLVESRGSRRIAREAHLVEKPAGRAPATHPVAWRILSELSREPDYPSHLAQRLRMHEQKVYYHVNRLREPGRVKTERDRSLGRLHCLGITSPQLPVIPPERVT